MRRMLSRHLTLLACCMPVLMLFTQPVLAENLLVNPGFESNVNVWGANRQYMTANGWTGYFPGALSYVEPEVAGFVPEPLTPHSGANAVRHVTDMADPPIEGWVVMYQDVTVVPGGTYTASIWLKAVDTAGAGFGQHPDYDSAMLWIQEYNADGGFVTEQMATAQKTPTDWTQQILVFTATPSTRTVRFMVETKIQCGSTPSSTQGYVGYDDAVLDGPKPMATVRGTVTVLGGAAVQDALVTIGDKSATTAADGTYTIVDIPISQNRTSVVCAKEGYYTETRRPVLLTGDNTVDFALVGFPTSNLLANPGWEEGGPTYPYGWNGNGGPDPQGFGWKAHFNSPIDEQGYIWQESDYSAPTKLLHSGANAIRVILGASYLIDVHLYQDVFVKGSTEYTARVWAKGSGTFGANPADTRGLWIQEFDSAGNLLVDHPQILRNTGTDEYELLSETFTTDANTVKIRYILMAVVTEGQFAAWVNFDDAILDGPAGTTTLTGVVRGDGAPLEGATVSAAGVSAVTGTDGVYSLDLSGKGSLFAVTASKAGYVSQLKQLTLQVGENTQDFDLWSAGNNLLANSGWEEPSPGGEGFGWQGSSNAPRNDQFHRYGWNAVMRSTTNNAFWQEKDYGDRSFHSGANAMRFVTTQTGGSAYAYQDVLVKPSTSYTARLFIRARGAFGQDPTDSAGLWITEYDVNGNPVAGGDHGKIELTQPTSDYVMQSLTFVTQPTTAWVRYAVDCVIQCGATAGSISFDDAVLDGPAGDSSFISGVVTSEGVPVAGATITAGSPMWDRMGLQASTKRTAVSGPDGSFTLDMGCLMTRVIATASKPGYYDEPAYIMQKPRTTEVNYNLTQLPASNLLANPGWEEGLPVWAGASPSVWSGNGWNGRALSDVTTVIEREWDFYQWFQNTIALHSAGVPGNATANAVRNVGLGENGHMDQWQEAAVLPNTTYRAGVWVRCGGLFGEGAADSAGMRITEYDADGVVTYDHPKIEQKTTTSAFGDYAWVRQMETFVTKPNTAKIRYTLDTVVTYPHPSTWVTYDDCFLEKLGSAYTTVAKIGSLAGMPDGTKVAMEKVVTVKQGDSYFYIEELDRSAGIRVQGNGTVGNWAEIRGTIRTVDGERTIVPDLLLQSASGLTIRPLGMINLASATTLSSGLYVRMWGRVSSADTGFFTMTDGSNAGLKVISSATVAADDYVVVTGALGSELSGDGVVPVLRAVTVTKVGP